DFGVPVRWAKTPREAAAIIYSIARREQRKKRKEPVIKDRKLPASLKELQEYVVASLPGVDSVLAKRLLEAFGSIREVFLASEEKLQRVEGIGPKTAKNIRWIIDSPYRRVPESS
ncbi:MAG: DEAD/DEAH box helicase, partial [Thaumarchaeota archaeon]